MAIEIIPDRICSHCGGNEWYTHLRKDWGTIKYSCVLKRKQDGVVYLKKIKNSMTYEKFREKNINYQKQYYNSEKEKESRIKSRIKNKDKIVISDKIRAKNATINLDNNYIKKILTSHNLLNYKDITSELIQLKKQQLWLFRKKELLKQKM